MFISPRRFWLGWLAAAVVYGGIAAATEIPPALLAPITASQSESEAEFRAMGETIAAARRLGPSPDVPAGALNAAAAGEFGAAVRLAPWVAEYQFQRGKQLAAAGRNTAAGYAFSLYLQAAPEAKDRREVANLIAALQRPPTAQPLQPGARLTGAGEEFQDCPQCPRMVVIPAGTFTMGSPPAERGRFDSEGPQHVVAVRSFALGRIDVTEKEFSEFLAETAYQPAPCDTIIGKSWRSPGHGLVYPPGTADLREQPAICVNAHDVEAYLAWLNRKIRDGHYRLPSEAEWEYAARAGTTSSRWWGEPVGTNNANCHGCGSTVGQQLDCPLGQLRAQSVWAL